MMLALAFSLAALPALAAASPEADLAALHCKPATVLRSEVKSCEANDAYTEAASTCLRQFEESTGKFAAQLSGVQSGGGQQLATEQGAKKKFSEAISVIDLLLATSERLGQEVKAYKSEVVLPDELGPVENGGMEITEYLGKIPCYHLSHELLDRTIELFHFKSEELRWTRKIAQAEGKKAGLRVDDLDQTSAGGKSVRATKGRSAGGVKGSSPKGASDITGTEEDKAKRK